MDPVNELRKFGEFYDNANYPRGFGKHGDFTIKQAEALHEFGKTMSMLSSGQLEPESAAEMRFVQVCNGEVAPESFLEKTWVIYQKKIAAGRSFFSPFNSLPSAQEEAEVDYADEDEDDMQVA